MVAKVESQNPKFDSVLWGVAVLLLSTSISAQYYFVDASLLWRLVGLFAASGVALWSVSRTQTGRTFISFWKEAIVELRKVIWPTRKETVHSTMAVIAMVFVVGLVLWSMDAILVRAMAWLIKGAV